MERKLEQAEGNKAPGQLKGRRHDTHPWAALQPEAALPGGELGRAFPSPAPYGAGVCPELTPRLPGPGSRTATLPRQNTEQECSKAPMCFFTRKVCTGFLNYIDLEGSGQEEGRGRGCFSHI